MNDFTQSATNTPVSDTIRTCATIIPGNAMAAPFTSAWTTRDEDGPTVTSSTPANGASGVSATAPITVTFSEAVTGFTRGELIGKDFSDYFTEPEKAKAGYETVFRDGDRLRMYYIAADLTSADGTKLSSRPLYACYAESRDGVILIHIPKQKVVQPQPRQITIQ